MDGSARRGRHHVSRLVGRPPPLCPASTPTADAGSLYLVLFPNVLLSLHPDYVMTHILTPLGPDRTAGRNARWAFAPEDSARLAFDPAYAIDFWDITNRQDWAACESVQRGLPRPTQHPAGPLSPREDGVYHYVTMVARGYRGLPLGTGAPGGTGGGLRSG